MERKSQFSQSLASGKLISVEDHISKNIQGTAGWSRRSLKDSKLGKGQIRDELWEEYSGNK